MTYLFQVHFHNKHGEMDYCDLRAKNKEDAINKTRQQFGDISIISVECIGN